MIAFFPLFPLLIGSVGRVLHLFLFPILSLSSLVIIVGITTNLVLFLKTAKVLIKLTSYHDMGMHHLATPVIYFFAFNPASIFFSALYTESMFSFLTASTIMALLEGYLFFMQNIFIQGFQYFITLYGLIGASLMRLHGLPLAPHVDPTGS